MIYGMCVVKFYLVDNELVDLKINIVFISFFLYHIGVEIIPMLLNVTSIYGLYDMSLKVVIQ